MKAPRISPEFLQKIKDSVSILEVVGEHVVLRKGGANYTGLCPFHSERSPSFSVSEQKQLYHCYGCKKGGDLVSFVMEIHGLSFIEAVEDLATRGRLAMPKEYTDVAGDSSDPATREKRQAAQEKLALAYKLNRFAAAFFHASLSQQQHIEKYFSARGVGDPDLVRSFYLGAAPASWDALSHHFVSKKAPVEVAVELGLIRPSQKQDANGPGFFDLFRNRAIFPILDNRGRVAGFGGRALPLPAGAPDVGGESPKYLNSPESLIFHKSKLAFGLYQAAKHIREQDEVILVEGYFDVLALVSAGFKNVVATCGTSLTHDHLTLFRRFGKKITVLFDGDRAGISATERAMEVGLDHGLVLYGAAMPAGLDPDELLFDQGTGKALPEGVERMKGILSGSKPLVDARIDEWILKSREDAESRTEAVKQIASWLQRFKDPVGREVRMEAAERGLGVRRELLLQAGAATARKSDARPDAPAATGQIRTSGPTPGASMNAARGHSSLPRGPAPLAVPQTRPAAIAKAKPTRLSPREKVLLEGLATAPGFLEMISEIEKKLPDHAGFSDLFDYVPAREFVAVLLGRPSGIDEFRKDPSSHLGSIGDDQLRTVLTEALMRQDSPPTQDSVVGAISKGSERLWARFSQQIKAALADAEAKKDAGLHSLLMKQYLDVQRRMKEFITFYDEA